LVSPAWAVDNEMVGNDSEGALMLGDGLFRRYCCWAAAAANRAACADCCSLDLGEVEKNWVSLAALENEVLRVPDFSDGGCGETAELGADANGFRGSL
jgi:hypothetical protein